MQKIEEAKNLMMQSQSMLNYTEKDFAALTRFLKQFFSKEIDCFVTRSLSSEE
jgi:hypothetical protein